MPNTSSIPHQERHHPHSTVILFVNLKSGISFDWSTRIMLSGQHEIPSVFRTSNSSIQPALPSKVTLKLLSGGEDAPVRILTLPANIGRVVDLRARPTVRNGLFNSPYLSRHHAVIRTDRGRVEKSPHEPFEMVGDCGRFGVH